MEQTPRKFPSGKPANTVGVPTREISDLPRGERFFAKTL